MDTRNQSWRLRKIAAAIGTTACLSFPAISLSVMSALPVGAAPAATTTRYMSTTDSATLTQEGCAQTNESGTVILDFGQAWWDGSTYGTIIFGSNTFRSTSDIENAAEAWLTGYWNCGGSGTVRLGVGTSNYHGDTNFRHRAALAQNGNPINN